ncbi:MAG: isochorismatase family protein [Gallicola sp.]|nr:isochorismatase family protein [Gallicola sp.]
MDLIIVDCQNDFIDGTMACDFANEAVDNIIEYFKEDMRVFYTSDFHPTDHMSFIEQGGMWPSHCVAGTWGAELHDKFHDSIFKPNNENTFFKGRHPKFEEYSGFEARNGNDEMLKDVVSDKVYIGGIASEYCVRETALAFKKQGKEVVILKDLLGYVNKEEHLKNLEDLKDKGIDIL